MCRGHCCCHDSSTRSSRPPPLLEFSRPPVVAGLRWWQPVVQPVVAGRGGCGASPKHLRHMQVTAVTHLPERRMRHMQVTAVTAAHLPDREVSSGSANLPDCGPVQTKMAGTGYQELWNPPQSAAIPYCNWDNGRSASASCLTRKKLESKWLRSVRKMQWMDLG